MLTTRDPLSERVHLNKAEAAATAAAGMAGVVGHRLTNLLSGRSS
jgi:hypothetical protein